jgi:hypothetical protein
MNGQLHPRRLHSRGKSRQYPLYRRLGEPQSQSGQCGEEKNLLPLPGITFNKIVQKNDSDVSLVNSDKYIMVLI